MRRMIVIGTLPCTLICVVALALYAQSAYMPTAPFTLKQAEFGKQLAATAAELQKQIPNANWADPAEPFKIIGNLYFVGPRYGEVYLLTSPQGHILLGAGMEKAQEIVERNIQTLGFKLTDVKAILLTHNHEDQAGGAAYLKAKTGAQVMAGFAEIPYLEHGIFNPPAIPAPAAPGGRGGQAAAPRHYPDVKVDRALFDGDVVKVGPLSVTAYLIPGHSPSPASFLFTVRDGGREYKVVDLCCWEYPDDLSRNAYITEATVRHTFATFAKMYPVDIYLAAAAYNWSGVLSQTSGTLEERIAKLKTDPKLWMNREIFNGFSAAREVDFEEKLAKTKNSNP
jgi:metallo-beta-lactamase class B